MLNLFQIGSVMKKKYNSQYLKKNENFRKYAQFQQKNIIEIAEKCKNQQKMTSFSSNISIFIL